MTLLKTKNLKSAVAALLSASLVVSASLTPAAAQSFRAGAVSEAGTAVRVSVPQTSVTGMPTLPASALGSATLAPSLAPAAAPSALALPAPISAAAAKKDDVPAAPEGAKTPAPSKPVVTEGDGGPRWVSPAPPKPEPKTASDSGPRWVKPAQKSAADGGPRWVGPAPKGIRATLAKYLPFLGKSGGEAFDGSVSGRGDVSGGASSVAGKASKAVPGLKPSARVTGIVEDHSIPTPEAARRVGELRSTPLWAKVVAPIAALGAVAVAVSVGAVPVLTLAAGLVVSVLAHEVAHIAVLHRLGDETAEHAHSHSLNPFKHIDAVKTVIVPAVSMIVSSLLLPFPILIGAGKPVDADFNNLRSPFGGPRSARNALWVAAAGPLTNLAIAGLAFAAASVLPVGGTLALVAAGLWKMNLALAVFNMLPLPQLDGGKILAAVLPERFYAKWVYNPRVERGYQGVFRRLYEGPSNVLTWVADFLGVRTQRGVNTLANVVTFTALAAFYAAAYFHLSLALPLLFLALPCSYDYWCIREKVRSEAAVQDLMEIMAQWSTVIVQISEDMGLDSEVSAYETEHAMKNALETLVDELMAKEEFRALSDEQKLEQLMKAYPDKAAEFLKEKAMTEDSLEKIKAVLQDPRNQPFYDRIKKWFGEHEIFKRWDNKEAQGKLKGAMEQADKKQSNGGRLPAFVLLGALGLGGGFTGMFPDWAPMLTALFGSLGLIGMLGTLGGGDENAPDPMAKVQSSEAISRYVISVDLVENANAADVERVFQGLEYTATAPSQGYYRVEIANRADGHLLARRIARDAAVARVTVNPELREQMNLPVPEPVALAPRATGSEDPFTNPVWTEKIKLNNGYPQKRVRVVFHNPSAARQEFRRVPGTGKEMKGNSAFETTLRTPAEAAEFARAIADEIAVKSVVVSAHVHGLLLSRNRANPAPAPAPDREPAAEQNPDQNELPFERTPSNEDPAPVEAPAPEAPAPVAETPAPPPAPTLPAKVVSHGKEDWSTTMVVVKFAEGAAESEHARIASETGAASRGAADSEGKVAYSYPTIAKAIEAAMALSGEATVSEIKVHPNAEATMLLREHPYPDAVGYDHQRTLLVQFGDAATDEFIKEYGEVRRLKLVRLNYRGASGLTAFEVPAPADFPVTARMLGEELGAAHLPVTSIRALVERPEVVIPEAQAAAAAEEKAPEAVQIPRRDPAQAWVEYLQNATLSDGKSKFTDKQVQLISFFLKPIAKSPEDQRAPVVARTEEIKRALPIITSPRGMRNSIILVGEAGVGKTAIAEGLAEMAEQAEHAALTGESSHLDFARLKGRWLVELDINEVLASEDPVKTLSAILKLLPLLNEKDPSAGNKVIVLMDEIQKFFLDPQGTKIANILKNPLRNGEVSVIAGTTSKEYKTYIEKDDAFRRRLEKIDVEEFTVDKTIRVLRAMKEWFQKLHKAVIPDQALVDAAKLTDQFDKTNFNPDKAIKAVQDAAELSRPENLRAAIALDIRETWGELAVAVNEARQLLLDKGIASTLALPAEHWNTIAGLVQKASDLYAQHAGVSDGRGKVTTDVVKRVIAQKTGIASGQLNLGEEDAARYNAMEEEVGKRVVNQDPALHAIANAIRRNKAGLSNPNRPMGKFLLTGPTGVGKTYLAKELARFLFNDPTAMVRFDMSEFMEEHAAMRLVGAPPSYVGYGEGGQLTEAVRKKPYSVVLFDEVEKAHPKVFDMLLQILDDGRLTDGEGRTIDFKNTVIIMTSNAGMSGVDGEKYARLIAKIEAHNLAVAAGKAVQTDEKPLPTVEEVEAAWDAEIDAMVADSLKSRFRPEFLNRLDEDPNSKNKWIRVNRLRQKDVRKIASIQLDEFKHLLADRHDTEFFYDQSVIDFLTVEGFSPLYGARPMTAAIEKHIVDPLAKWILQEAAEGRKDARGGRITVTVKDGAIEFRAQPKPIKDVVKMTVQGAAESVAAETFRMLETLVSDGQGEEPSEAAFDAMMRRAAPKAAPDQAKAEDQKERTRAFFAPGASLKLASAPAAAEHNNAKKKDAAMRGAIASALEKAKAAGWGAEAAGLLDTPADGQGEGWLKQLVKLAKEQATRAGSDTPVTLGVEAGADALRVAVSGAYAMSDDEIRSLMMHFSGVPPESYKAAQNKVDNLNLTAKLLWDHNLLDLYRRASAIPGARMGFKTGAEGTQIWLEIRRETGPPALEDAPKAAASAPEGPQFAGTPHQQREMAKLRELLFRVIDQSKMSENQRDGHSIRIAAAEGYASLAQPSDAATAREWIRAKGWAGRPTEVASHDEWSSSKKTDSEVGANWPLALTAALILERFGGAEDVELLENMARRITGTSHYEVPVHGALVSALSAIYVRLGLKAVREASIRAAQITEGRTTDITNAVRKALGTVGMPADAVEAKGDPDAHLAMMKRLGRTAELMRIFRDTTFWGTNSETAVREAALKLAGETGTLDDLNRLKNMMRTQTGYSTTAFETARAWASIVVREKQTAGLGDAMKRYLDARGVKDYSLGSTWAFLYAMVETAKLAGGAGELQALEELMDAPPNDIASVNEQAYFNSPEAWARSLVRSGKFEEYARPQGLTPDGAPRPSKLQEMLVNQTRPMKAAAALRALALARDPNFSKAPIVPAGPLPELRPDSGSWNSTSSSSSSSTPRGPSNPRFRDPPFEPW